MGPSCAEGARPGDGGPGRALGRVLLQDGKILSRVFSAGFHTKDVISKVFVIFRYISYRTTLGRNISRKKILDRFFHGKGFFRGDSKITSNIDYLRTMRRNKKNGSSAVPNNALAGCFWMLPGTRHPPFPLQILGIRPVEMLRNFYAHRLRPGGGSPALPVSVFRPGAHGPARHGPAEAGAIGEAEAGPGKAAGRRRAEAVRTQEGRRKKSRTRRPGFLPDGRVRRIGQAQRRSPGGGSNGAGCPATCPGPRRSG